MAQLSASSRQALIRRGWKVPQIYLVDEHLSSGARAALAAWLESKPPAETEEEEAENARAEDALFQEDKAKRSRSVGAAELVIEQRRTIAETMRSAGVSNAVSMFEVMLLSELESREPDPARLHELASHLSDELEALLD